MLTWDNFKVLLHYLFYCTDNQLKGKFVMGFPDVISIYPPTS